jgi:O-antigen/teichoic acid export membrane protein
MTEPGTEKTGKAEKLVKNSIWLFTAEGLSKIIALMTQVFAARFLGGEGYGIFSFAFAATGAFIVFIDTGLSTFLTREVSRHPEKTAAYLKNVFALKWKLSSLTCLILALAMSFASLEQESLFAAIAIGLALMIQGYAEMYLSVFRAFENMRLVSILMVAHRVLFFVLGLGVLLSGGDVVFFSSAFLTASVVILIIARRQMARQQGIDKTTHDRQLAGKIFKDSLPICALILFTYIYFRIDAVLVFFLLGKLETGWYSAAFKLVETLALLIASIRFGVFPVLSKTFKEGSDHYQKIWQETTRYLLLISIPVAVGMILLSQKILALLYGGAFETAGPVLQIMALGFPLLCLNDLASYLLLSQNKTRSVLRIAGFAAVFNVVLNIFLIQKWGMAGAAWATALTQGLVFLAYYKKVREICGQTGILTLLVRPVLASAMMAWLLIGWGTLPLIPAVLLGMAVYIIALIALRTFNDSDRRVFRRVFKRDQLKGGKSG